MLMSTEQLNQNTQQLHGIDRARIQWATARYDLWLDLHFTKPSDRRELRRELAGNLTEAASNVGVSEALRGVGSLRRLARETSQETGRRSRWYAGFVAGLSVFVLLVVGFIAQTLMWAEGVQDAGVTHEVHGSLFPFVGSNVAIDPSPGMAMTIEPGPLPFVAALAVFLVVAKPWRATRQQQPSWS